MDELPRDQEAQDAFALMLALLRKDDSAFRSILESYEPSDRLHNLVVSLAGLAGQLAEERTQTPEELEESLTRSAIWLGHLRHPGIRRPDEAE